MINLNGKKVKETKTEEKFKSNRLSPFDFLNDLGESKKGLFNDQTEGSFDTFMINRGFSQGLDTIMFANEMNKHWHLSKEMVHDFYLYIIPKRKRRNKWAKQNKDNKETIDLIVNHYKVNRTVAIDYLKLLSLDDIQNLKKLYETGGRK